MLSTRRVVVGNSKAGQCVVVSDDRIQAVSRGIGENIVGSEMWSTSATPASNAPEHAAGQSAGYVGKFNTFNYVGSGGGSTFRITEWLPGHARFTHRTQTLDYDVVLSGEIDLELEGGETVHLREGDVVIVRGCTHTWVNRSQKPAVTAFILLDAAPLKIDGELLQPIFPAP